MEMMYYKSRGIATFLKSLLFFFYLLGLNQLMMAQGNELRLNQKGYYEKSGLNVMVFSNWYDGNFSDSKISGIEIIHHGVRTATNGDVRLNSTPGQWDPIPELVSRKTDSTNHRIEAYLRYPKFSFNYVIKTEARDGGIYIGVYLEKPLPESLIGKAGLNLEFIPSAYFEKTYYADNKSGNFPLYPSGEMFNNDEGKVESLPFAQGKNISLAPEDPMRNISIRATEGKLMMYDGRNLAQNGWFVVRTLIPSNRTGKVVEWFLSANAVKNWIRPPVIGHSQVGYHPNQEKIAVIEVDKNDSFPSVARLLRVDENGKCNTVISARTVEWGEYLRYKYAKFDFSYERNEGLYMIECGGVRTKAFRISKEVYKEVWHLTQDIFMPVQMDHMFVKEAYRVWHGASHLDDARQAPVNYEHFDLYAQGPTTDSPFGPGEHIPGLNVGGWFDAGDFDIRTETHYDLILKLVHAWEQFLPRRDETTINEFKRYVNIHVPDRKPDMLQQIEHGTLALIAQYRVFGHAIPGIIAPDLTQYTHLGDASTITDNLVCDELPKPFHWEEFSKCSCDDRWAFTTRCTALDYGSVAALAGVGRVLRGYNDSLSSECIRIAKSTWDREQREPAHTFHFGNTTGGPIEVEELNAAVELLILTKENKYAEKINELLPYIEKNFGRVASSAILAIPYMNSAYKMALEEYTLKYKIMLDNYSAKNPYGVIISAGGWAGNGQVINSAITCYMLNKTFPEIIGPEYVYRGLNYIFGSHPGSDISFVSGVGTHSKRVAYGNNRADFTYIAGGIVPGVLLLKPDFPENKEDWPFLWGENEYVINLSGSYIFLVNAVNELLERQ